MRMVIRKSREWAQDRTFVILVCIQLVLLFVDTVLDRNGANALLAALLIAVFVFSVVAALESVDFSAGRLKVFGGIAVVLRLSEAFGHVNILSIALDVAWGAFSLGMVAHLVRFALRRDHHAIATKLAAVASAYVAFPQFWNVVFLLIQAASPNAFHPGQGERLPLDYQDMLLFSYNVFTTVDVSDVLPVTRLARAAVVLAEISAQLFVVIFIARLVGVFPPHSPPPERDGHDAAKPSPRNE